MEKLIQFHNSNTIKAAICHKPQLWSTTMMFLLMITLLLAVAVLSSGEETTQQRSLRIKEEKELEAFTWGGGVPRPPVPGPSGPIINSQLCTANGLIAVPNNLLTAQVRQIIESNQGSTGRTFISVRATCVRGMRTVVFVIVRIPGGGCVLEQATFVNNVFQGFTNQNNPVACPLFWPCIPYIPCIPRIPCMNVYTVYTVSKWMCR